MRVAGEIQRIVSFGAPKVDCRFWERDVAKRAAQPEKDYHVPLGQTLKWIEKGKQVLREWSLREGIAAEKMVESLRKMLEKLEKEAETLWELHKKETKGKTKTKKR
jgi:hypothetical protein